MEDVFHIIRTIHVLAGSFWLGEVVVINFILIPVLSRFEGEYRKSFMVNIFPRIFDLASILSATVVLTGMFLVYHMTNGDFSQLTEGRWGWSILVGGSLGTILTLFHFFMENKLAKKIGLGACGDDTQIDDVHLKLKLVPRLGLIVIVSIFLLMINAAHGVV